MKRASTRRSFQKSSLLVVLSFAVVSSRNRLLSNDTNFVIEDGAVARKEQPYLPSRLESSIMQRSTKELHYDVVWADECDLYLSNRTADLHMEYLKFLGMLDSYYSSIESFELEIEDLRSINLADRSQLCRTVDFLTHFEAGYLSLTRGGFVEPLLPPLRHPEFCKGGVEQGREALLSLRYLVHDFAAICQALKKSSRTVFFDLGASLEFHGTTDTPALSLTRLFARFGITFDHYYAFEYTSIDDERVFDAIPPHLLPAYHWFNVGIAADPLSKNNPWTSLLSKYDKDDFIVVKLDIDTPAIELDLTHQLFQKNLSILVDHFYFEHHVKMRRMKRMGWKRMAQGTLLDSLSLFSGLRESGIAAHSWV